MVRISLLTDVKFRFLSYLKQSFFIEPKNVDDQQHPAVILVAFYFNGYSFCGVICALIRSFRIFTLHIPTMQLACTLTKWRLFLYCRTFPEKKIIFFTCKQARLPKMWKNIKNYFPKIIGIICLSIKNCCSLTNSKSPFLCVKTISCHMIEKTNRLSLKNRK